MKPIIGRQRGIAHITLTKISATTNNKYGTAKIIKHKILNIIYGIFFDVNAITLGGHGCLEWGRMFSQKS